MAGQLVEVDLSDREFRKLSDKLAKYAGPKRFPRLLKSMINGGLAPIRRDIRKQIRRENAIRFGHMYRAVKSKVKVYASGTVFGVVGAQDKKLGDGENPGNYFHLVSEGVKPHIQQARVQVNGRWFLLPGTQLHPGVAPRRIRDRAARSAASEVVPRTLKRGQAILDKEMTR